MSENIDGNPGVQIYVPPEAMQRPQHIWLLLNQVIGQNVRVKAHELFHQTIQNETLSPGEQTMKFAQIQGLLDYADEVDPGNARVTEKLLEHFLWKFPTQEDRNGTN